MIALPSQISDRNGKSMIKLWRNEFVLSPLSCVWRTNLQNCARDRMGGKIPVAPRLHCSGTLHRLRKTPLLPIVPALGHFAQRLAIVQYPQASAAGRVASGRTAKSRGTLDCSTLRNHSRCNKIDRRSVFEAYASLRHTAQIGRAGRGPRPHE
jgi:hypothetical protein